MAATRKAKKPDKKHPIVVIGGGPAGMTAAQTAAGHGSNVVVFDKNPEPGKKLQSLTAEPLFISEDMPSNEMAGAFGDKAQFILPSLRVFDLKALAEHLNAMNIQMTPNGNSHMMVLPEMTIDLPVRLRRAAENAGAVVKKSSKVSDIVYAKGQAEAVIVNSVKYPVSAVIVACGSVASPARGATDDGYEFARKAGHSIVPIRAALVGLETVERYGNLLAGAEFADCAIQVTCDDEPVLRDRGGLKFTGYGVEGDLILTHSARIIDLLGPNGARHHVEIHIDMVPDIKKKEMEAWLIQQSASSYKITVGAVFDNYIPQKLRAAMGKIVRIHSDKPISNLSHLERKLLLMWVKDFHVTIRRPRPFNETRGVSGGVSIDEVDPETLRSRKIKNLFFAGEVLDLLGPWGGYNFHKAFATGYLAGLSAAKAVAG
jgi:hypothetical protein